MMSYRGFLVCAAAALVSCTDSVRPGDPRFCQQTYEFGNTGCIEITGRVTGLRGQPLSRISVYAYSVSDRNGGASMTDTTGVFTLRVTRMSGVPPKAGPDTTSVWVRAADPRSASGTTLATIVDSALVLATFTPVGSMPTPMVANFTLQAP